VADGGGMSALIAAAQQEGTLNVISLPPAWVNYGAIISEFSKTYGITVAPAEGIFNSQQEVDAVRQHEGSAAAPDVLDIGMSVALAHTDHFARYQVQTWSAIPADQKDPAGLWYQDYGGYMAIGYDSARFGTITSVSQLLEPRFAGAVALGGLPQTSKFALSDVGTNGVMMINLAVGGTPDDIATGVAFFRELDAAGNFVPTQASTSKIMSGKTPVVINWEYAIGTAKLERARTDHAKHASLNAAVELPGPTWDTASTWDAASTWKVFVPPAAVLGHFFAQAINKAAPHPAAARLWEEFLYSQDPTGGQNMWLEGGARPVQLEAMRLNGTLDPYLAHDLLSVTGTPVFLSQAQAEAASAYLATNWTRAVRSARR
jgi:putative spermidine/putrescine transport system substrate-binding protein